MGDPAARRSPLKTALYIVGAVVVLAVVMFALSAVSGSRSLSPEVVVERTPAQESQQALADGQSALASGDTSEAVRLLTKAVSLDPANTTAADLLESITGPAQSPDSDTGGGSTSPTVAPQADDAAFNRPIDDLAKLLPASASGYILGSVVGSKPDVTRSGTPQGEGGVVRQVVWTVHDRGTAAKAKKFVEDVSKVAYGKQQAAPMVDGTKGYFGTDGTRFASVVYVRGRYVFEVVVTSVDVPPAQVRSQAEEAARAFPDSP